MTADPESISWLRIVMASTTVLGLLGLLSVGLKYVASQGLMLPGKKNVKRRLQLIETLALDTRRRLVIVRQDGHEHLLLLGVGQDIVVKTNLQPTPTLSETFAKPD